MPRYVRPRRFGVKSRKRRTGRFGLRRMPRARTTLRQPVQYFKRSWVAQKYISTAPGVDYLGRMAFSLSQVYNSNEFTSLYDQYCIRGIKVKLIPRFNVSTSDQIAAGNITMTRNNLFSVVDTDDSNFPASINDLMEYQNMHVTPTTSIMKRYFKPKVNMAVADNPIPGSFAHSAKSNTWIDCGDPNVVHNGIKFGIPAGPVQLDYDAVVTFYLAFKGVR